MNYLRTVVSMILASVVSNNAFSQSLDLIQAYKEAVDQDPLIAAAKYQAQAGDEKYTQGKSLLLPKFNLGANIDYKYSKSESDPSAPFDRAGKSDGYGVNAQLVQPVFRSANMSAYEQSKLAVDQSEIQLAIAEQDLLLRVTKAYFDVLSAEENVAVSQSQTRAFSESLERAKLTFKVGTATKTDMLEAQARYDIAVASEIAAGNQLAVTKQTLAIIIGDAPDSLKKLEKSAKLQDLQPADMKHWVDTAFANNLNLKLANLGVDVSSLEVKKLKGDQLPTIDFVASASQNQSYSTFTDADTTTTNLGVSLQLAMPLYTGGLVSSRIREAEALRLQQKQVKTNSERQVQLQTQQAYLNALSGKQQADALQQALISNESALEATKKGVEVGVRTNLDLLDAQQRYFATQRDFTVAKYNYLLTVLQLKAAAGVLNVKDIEELNSLLTLM